MDRQVKPEVKVVSSGMSVPALLGVLFVALKLTGHIDWSWWWVLAPFWVPFVLVALICGAVFTTLIVWEYQKGRR